MTVPRSSVSGPVYVELQVSTNFTFLRGASHAEELALSAAALGHAAIAVTDRNSLAGVVRAHIAAKGAGIRLVVGCRLDLTDGPSLLCLPTDRAAYGRLSRLLTVGRRRAPKGQCELSRADLYEHDEGQILIAVPPEHPDDDFVAALRDYRARFRKRLYLAASHLYRGDDARRLAHLAALAVDVRVPLVATNDVHYHAPHRRVLQDVLTCIREHRTLHTAGYLLAANAERHLKAPEEMARLFHRYPGAVARTAEIAAACAFSLDELRYEYPDEITAEGRTAQQELAHLTALGAAERYPEGVPAKVQAAIDHELPLIEQLGYAPYFLTVHDIVRFARSRDILCQGRGSAANSAVCYCLGITAVDPARSDLLFERFVSAARNEPPDIDVDFEHERREEVIQYIYAKYGRDRAGIAATVSRYRARGAVRDVGKVFGLSEDTVGRLAGSIWGWGREGIDEERAREHGLDPADPTLRRVLDVSAELLNFPRHLGQHVGGFIITRGPLSELCPIVNAAMPGRTTIEWDKDDIDALGILKVDVLALGMLTCVRKGFDLLARHYGKDWTLATIPAEDKAVYAMLCKADSLGVFQVESRAQMSMLPRLRPKTFYDLVVQVAIVRPGPIQGDMVHPYLRRRQGKEKVEYPSEELRQVLEKTLGVPLFQEQAMKIAIVAAGFTPSEADQLRRAMATFKKVGIIHTFREKMIEGMVARNYDRAFAERCFHQIEGFGTYGFPESHASSFALLVYVSAWMKCHHPDVFACALLNSQPMGFYAPAQIVRDAQEHGVTVRSPDLNHSDWDCTLEPVQEEGGGGRFHALRLGLRQIKGFRQAEAAALMAARLDAPFRDPPDVRRRSGLSASSLELLAQADAWRSLGLDRRAALWAVQALGPEPLPLFARLDGAVVDEPEVALPEMALGEHVVEDYSSLSLSLKCHPLTLLRDGLGQSGILPTSRLAEVRHGTRMSVAGLVLVRQRPGSADGVVFITLEDEHGVANLIVVPPVFERFRKVILTARLIGATGRVERQDGVIHLLADHLADLSFRLRELTAEPDYFQPGAMAGGIARADEVKRPTADYRKSGEVVQVFPDGRNFK
ncbi:error-prone DNA polymerase 1 [Skermanella aerolata]|uniref:Error-prone DNA polymerase n=1 Tax=Skermanella aerolata TaxID=393310 RepID=A0A512DIN8_9PROT|nr:error-prone DNA polymerase [Skermanella aerolata]KJB97458.1 DNA polymerase [Skermanella aerolata KACC 11604]GEO36341.1 error-prone DNA polymerase 1 [Skermanella aerolata]